MQTWIRANIGKLIARFGGMALQLITAAEFAALEVKDPATLYTVTESGADNVALYLGDKPIGRGGSSTTRAVIGTTHAAKKKRKRRSK